MLFLGEKVKLTSIEMRRLRKLTHGDPSKIKTKTQLVNYIHCYQAPSHLADEVPVVRLYNKLLACFFPENNKLTGKKH